jgi:DNA-binding winged helix-turn-helix (wHTH) protein/tetratricopeptide (TPR) repeat protein
MAFTRTELNAGFRLGQYLIEPRQNRIARHDHEVRLEPRVMDVLVCLAERAGEVVSRDSLNEQVWGKLVVTDQAVTNCISELRHHLGDDRSTHRVIETIPKRGYRLMVPVQLAQLESLQTAPSAAPAPASVTPRRSRFTIALSLLVAIALGLLWWWRTASEPVLTSVTVLRFENAANDETLDYLSLALPDEMATLLTKSRGLAVRPFGYVNDEDSLASARDRRVDHIVTGRFYLEDHKQLSLAIEALHVPQERVIWRTRITAPNGDLLAMRERIAESVRQGLLPALGARALASSAPTPANDEAYQLYLRSLALPQQPNPTERAIEMLRQVVSLEPSFAPAWHALGLRYYDYGTWWGGGEPARRQSLAAHRKALELDPNSVAAARNIVSHRVEAGDLEGAYQDARRLLEDFGPSADTHFTLSYVYRYGGEFESSQRHCELALARDPHDPRLRSCGYAYLYVGKLSRVLDFLKLDEGAFFVHWGTVLYYLRLENREAALNVTRQAADEPTRRLMQPCLEGANGAALDEPVTEFVRHWERSGDPEAAYAVAPMLVFCGRPQEALRLVERSVDTGFCAFPALDLDPIWSRLRSAPEFQRVRLKAKACNDEFRRMIATHGERA